MQGLAGTWGAGYKHDGKCAGVVSGHIQAGIWRFCLSDSVDKRSD